MDTDAGGNIAFGVDWLAPDEDTRSLNRISGELISCEAAGIDQVSAEVYDENKNLVASAPKGKKANSVREQLTLLKLRHSLDYARKVAEEEPTAEDLFEMQKDIVFEILEQLGFPRERIAPHVIRIIKVPHTKCVRALKKYSIGLVHLDRQQFAAAKQSFQEAAEIDPDFGLASEAFASTPFDASRGNIQNNQAVLELSAADIPSAGTPSDERRESESGKEEAADGAADGEGEVETSAFAEETLFETGGFLEDAFDDGLTPSIDLKGVEIVDVAQDQIGLPLEDQEPEKLPETPEVTGSSGYMLGW